MIEITIHKDKNKSIDSSRTTSGDFSRRSPIVTMAKPGDLSRRKMPSKGIRFFDLGVELNGEEWETVDYVAGVGPQTYMEKLLSIPVEEWGSRFKLIDS